MVRDWPSASRGTRQILAVASAWVLMCGGSGLAAQQTALTPPPGNTLFLSTTGVGTQDYICLPTKSLGVNAFAFVRPESGLSIPLVGRYTLEVAENILAAVPGQVLTPDRSCVEAVDGKSEFCPTWRSPSDLSAVYGTTVESVPAGSNAACPNAGAITCLLLRAVATGQGQITPNLLGKTTYIQRLNTVGGSAPTAQCTVGQIAQVAYRATYNFYSSAQ